MAAEYDARVIGDALVIGDAAMTYIDELSSNSLLRCPDLCRLTALAAVHNFAFVVDDTVSDFCNVDLLHSQPSQVSFDNDSIAVATH